MNFSSAKVQNKLHFIKKNTRYNMSLIIISVTLHNQNSKTKKNVNILNNKQLIITSDGSHSFYVPDLDETYHSKHGAIQEAYHVFIKSGLEQIKNQELAILEIGFGTGLNAFITFLEGQKNKKTIHYTGVEAFPLQEEEIKHLNYVAELNAEKYKSIFKRLHSIKWNKTTALTPNFFLEKKLLTFDKISDVNQYHLIYFDAFGPRVQPELWTEAIFTKMYQALLPKGILVTYSAKGSVRRALLAVGFTVEKIPGPPGKREMLRAVK